MRPRCVARRSSSRHLALCFTPSALMPAARHPPSPARSRSPGSSAPITRSRFKSSCSPRLTAYRIMLATSYGAVQIKKRGLQNDLKRGNAG